MSSTTQHTPADEDAAWKLRKLDAVRAQAHAVLDLAQKEKDLPNDQRKLHWAVDMSQVDAVVDYVIEIMKADYGTDFVKIPFHSRWRHVDAGGITRKTNLLRAIPKTSDINDLSALPNSFDSLDPYRALLDMVIISVLLDAGAGPQWKFEEKEGEATRTYNRSEGLAVAAYHMFMAGVFSSNKSNKFQVDSIGLKNLALSDIQKHFQLSETNTLVGLEGRHQLLRRLGEALEQHPKFFASKHSKYLRPGNLLEYLENNAEHKTIHIDTLWRLVMEGFEGIWPESRTRIGARNMGDVWPLQSLADNSKNDPYAHYVPFHKLSQWLTYSLIEPIEESGIKVKEVNKMTGLAEYRNGGLFYDMKVVTPLKPITEPLPVHSPEIVEWRALTVALLDVVGERIRQKFGHTAEEFPLAKVLEGGTWKAGRKQAFALRNGLPPFPIELDGTVF